MGQNATGIIDTGHKISSDGFVMIDSAIQEG
jgi:hypothetical protein